MVYCAMPDPVMSIAGTARWLAVHGGSMCVVHKFQTGAVLTVLQDPFTGGHQSASCTAGSLSATAAPRRENRDELLFRAFADDGVNLPPCGQVCRSVFEGLRDAALNGQQP